MINRAPQGWEIQSIDEIVFFQEGPGVRNTQFTQSGVKLLNVGNINDSKIDLSRTKIYISEDEAYGKYKHFLVDSGDLLIACSGIVVSNFHNKIAFVKDSDLPLCMNTSTMRFKTLDPKKLSLDFFRYFLMTDVFKHQLQKLITGSAQLNFGPSHIKQMSIILPPLPQQEKIVSVLDTASALVEKQKTLLEKYDLFLKSKFIEMFGDPVKNPMGWEIVKLGKYGKLARGKSSHRPRNAPFLYGGDYPFIQTGDVARGNNTYITKYTQTYSEEGIKQSRVFPKDTIAITIAANIGDAKILSFDSYFPDSVVGFNVKIPLFVVFLLKFYKQSLDQQATSTAQKNINLQVLNDLDVIYPSFELQNQFAQIVEQVEVLKEKEQQKLEKLQTLYDALMKRAFDGEIH